MSAPAPDRRAPFALLRAVAAIAAGAAGAAILLLAVTSIRGGAIDRSVENGGDWYARTPAWFSARGLYPTEHAPDGSAFAWAGGRLRLQIPRLDRSTRYTLRLHVRSGRHADQPAPLVRVAVDGMEAAPASIGAEWQTIDVELPRSTRAGVLVLLDTDQTLTPAPPDRRALAFVVDRLTLVPAEAGAIPLPRATLIDVAMFAAAIALAAVLCGLPIWLVFCSSAAAGGVAVWLVSTDAAFLSAYSAGLTPLGGAALVAAAIGSWLARFATASHQPAWRAAVLLAATVTVLRLAVFLHPNAPVSDGMFHVHRAQDVRAGNYIFTSITPEPFYEFPYPVGLYVAAQPFWQWVADRIVLLRGIVLVADALVALALFGVVASRWGHSSGTGLLACATALAFPVVVQSVSTANLTNVFAQSCFSLAVLWIAWSMRSSPIAAGIGAALLSSAAYLSHFSTAVIGVPAAAMIAVALVFASDPADRRAWRWIALSVAASMVLSYAAYYVHFHDVYARTFSKLGAAGPPTTSLVATLAEHSESKPITMARFLVSNYGWGGLALAVVGAGFAIRRAPRDGWTLTVAALMLAVTIFLVLGAVTPIEMRANLAAHPALAALAALGCASLWTTGHVIARAGVVATVGAMLWTGVMAIAQALG
jgi:hypothetical protein